MKSTKNHQKHINHQISSQIALEKPLKNTQNHQKDFKQKKKTLKNKTIDCTPSSDVRSAPVELCSAAGPALLRRPATGAAALAAAGRFFAAAGAECGGEEDGWLVVVFILVLLKVMFFF